MLSLIPLLVAPLLVPAPAAPAVAPAQCCLGAQNCEATSHRGRYRVKATSLTGTGPSEHGPYHFEFETFRVGEDGVDERVGVFRRRWETREHFLMQVFVSPTGNGFLLGTSLQPELQFLAPDGKLLREVRCSAEHRIAYPESTPDSLAATVPGPLYVALESRAEPEFHRTFLWLPMAELVGPEYRWDSETESKWCELDGSEDTHWSTFGEAEELWLARMLTRTPARGESEREGALALVAELRRDPHSKANRDALVELGVSARPPLEDAVSALGDLASAARAVLDEIQARLCGHAEPWQDLELLEAIADHPSATLRRIAAERLDLLKRE